MTIDPNENVVPDPTTRRSIARTGAILGGTGVLVAGGAAALLTALAGSAGAAATITVDSSADGVADATHCTDLAQGNCTLRDAVAAAVDGDTITFDASISNITLTNGGLLTQAVNFVGPGASALTITTAGAPGAYNLFRISGNGDVVISGMTLTKNRVKSLNTGTLTLDGVTISGSTGDYGGALYASQDSALEIIDSTFENNSATTNGGAIYIYNGADATISGSTFTNNDSAGGGGAIYSSDVGNFTMTNSTVSGNSAGEQGGGIELYGLLNGVATITDSTFDSNHADLYGGALQVGNDITVTVSNTTVSNNTANGGGGLSFDGTGITAEVNNSTITANSTVNGAAGIYINGGSAITINQSTITSNVNAGTDISNGGAGLSMENGTSVVTVSGSIISGNTSNVPGSTDIGLYSTTPSDTGSFTATNSLIGEVDSRLTNNGSDNVSTTDPMLEALADNGGPTKTMALLPGSPAIDAGPDPVATFTGNQFDQRGTGYARVVGDFVDIGAFEIQPEPEPTTTTTAATDPVVPAFTG